LVHRTYMGAHTQMHVYDNRITLWNDGALPIEIKEEDLKREHKSKPRNPIIAHACFMSGYIDTWGRGTLKIIDSCKEAGLPEPIIKELQGGIEISILKKEFTIEVTEQVINLILAIDSEDYTSSLIMAKLKLKHRPTFLYTYIQPALEQGFIEMTIPDKPKSSKQKYRLTEKGKGFRG